jgi:hypothetical protein
VTPCQCVRVRRCKRQESDKILGLRAVRSHRYYGGAEFASPLWGPLMRLSIMCVLALLSSVSAFAQTAPTQPAIAQTANPELVGKLTRALGATPKQAEGAAGSLFAAAKSRMKPQDWSRVARVVPGLSGLLKSAPSVGVADKTASDLGSLANAVGLGGAAGELGTIAMVAAAFQKLGLNPELAAQAASIITNYVKQKGGVRVAQLLSGALK